MNLIRSQSSSVVNLNPLPFWTVAGHQCLREKYFKNDRPLILVAELSLLLPPKSKEKRDSSTRKKTLPSRFFSVDRARRHSPRQQQWWRARGCAEKRRSIRALFSAAIKRQQSVEKWGSKEWGEVCFSPCWFLVLLGAKWAETRSILAVYRLCSRTVLAKRVFGGFFESCSWCWCCAPNLRGWPRQLTRRWRRRPRPKWPKWRRPRRRVPDLIGKHLQKTRPLFKPPKFLLYLYPRAP